MNTDLGMALIFGTFDIFCIICCWNTSRSLEEGPRPRSVVGGDLLAASGVGAIIFSVLMICSIIAWIADSFGSIIMNWLVSLFRSFHFIDTLKRVIVENVEKITWIQAMFIFTLLIIIIMAFYITWLEDRIQKLENKK